MEIVVEPRRGSVAVIRVGQDRAQQFAVLLNSWKYQGLVTSELTRCNA